MLQPRTNILADDPKTIEAPEKNNKKPNFPLCRVYCPSSRVLWLKSHNYLKIHIVSHQFTKSDWMGMKVRKISKQKTDRLQKGYWNDKRFDRG